MRYRLIPALFLITLGSLFLLDNLGLARFDLGNLVSTWWPAFLIAAGVRQLLRYRQRTAVTC
ncbi:hypothetical protein JH271_13365 [Xanthomonas campestris pv. campestris]|uniref:LiaI-LiaF-like transmembrane region domain-containing protein n=2 Tax=Xanthomonas campestris pv. campestris TaxID=340 RepID=Q8P7P2_XANCP|nr:DUF5668 domain-containing protein [Xanthomonas campestris]AAM41841.1 conserved hypothetical protein [Xanthomonas campestris pv. campestris str. ATCC 33913]AAY48615.1 conserved hypothetical protein [Xanthomonas campestris pv. campestris str. 8004]AKS15805.1 membrane protein [Xanthomonas campestris pv. campestris]AKS19825.1 membrane protein [Xanthomonas campestris pv. campestris]ALE69269.1 membrane protein [Xanthomonas campestris pv. campestris]